MDKNIKNIFNALDKINKDSSMLSDNTLSVVDDWIDTDSYALNAICSGSLYKGIPVGRITGLVGPSGCGKTLLMLKIMANAQKKGMIPVIWDSEAAADKQTAENLGCNPNEIKYCPIDTVEDCRNQMLSFLDQIIEDESLHGKFIIGLDSLGNLASKKELEDALSNKNASDMGLRAKVVKSMMRTMTYKCAQAKVPFIFSNHIYDDPSSMFPSLIKNQGGGKGPTYLASLMVQMGIKQEKSDSKTDVDELLPIANKVKGVTLSAMTTKNRFVPPFLKTEIYINFLTGISKYAGLKDLAVAFGVIEQAGATYTFKGEKIGYAKTWENNKDFWSKCLPELENILQSKLKYNKQLDVDNLEETINDEEGE